MTADFFSKKAADHAASCTEHENQRRRENGRQSNVSHIYTDGEAENFLGGADASGNESEYQPTRFGTAFGTAFA